MPKNPLESRTSRRTFIQYLGMLGVGGQVLLRSGDARGAVYAAKEAIGESKPWPKMTYTNLGRTGFRASRLIFGCGAALARRPNDALLDAAYDAGINVFDVGFRYYYRDAEKNLAPFLKKRRDDVFLISKAGVDLDVESDEKIKVQQARAAAAGWLQQLDASLRELGVDHVDAYYLMASHNPSLIESEEIRGAFEKAKGAGKVKHLGLSTHRNAARVLEAAIRAGGYDLAMIAITPAGWYDWESRGILADTKPMVGLQPLLARARESGIGLAGMKAGRHLAGRRFFGWSSPDAFDRYYDEKLMKSGLSAFQRSYAFVLAHGLDVVNADMQSFAHLQENVTAAAISSTLFA